MIEAPSAIRDLLADATRRLRSAAVDQPERESGWIWEKLTGRSRVSSITGASEPVSEREVLEFQAAISRRLQGEPLAHVLGESAFRYLLVGSDRRALIPRPETEGLVDLVLERQGFGTVVDIGTGSGCIALSLASEGDYDLVVAVERSSVARGLAQANITRSGLPVTLIAGDLSSSLGSASVDILVSNPPYLSDAEYAALTPEVKDWEPELALRSGTDGLGTTRTILADGLRVVRPGGWLVLEIDCSRAAQVTEAAIRTGWVDVLVKDDLFGRARYLVARRSE